MPIQCRYSSITDLYSALIFKWMICGSSHNDFFCVLLFHYGVLDRFLWIMNVNVPVSLIYSYLKLVVPKLCIIVTSVFIYWLFCEICVLWKDHLCLCVWIMCLDAFTELQSNLNEENTYRGKKTFLDNFYGHSSVCLSDLWLTLKLLCMMCVGVVFSCHQTLWCQRYILFSIWSSNMLGY